MELNKQYLLSLKKKLNAEKRKFNKGYKKFGANEIEFHPFLEEYAIPLANIKHKIEEFKEYFTELHVKYPKLPEFTDTIHHSIIYWYKDDTIVEEFNYKGEKIDVEYDHVTTSIHPFFHEYINSR